MPVTLDEDAIDDILYLARVNETAELDAFLSELSLKTKHAKDDLISAAVDPYSKNTALHYAAANGHSDVIKALLSDSLDKATASTPAIINAKNDADNTPLHWAALNGHLDCVKLLVELGADVTIINGAGHDAVFEAEINDKKDVVDWLLGAVEALEKGIGNVEETSESSPSMNDVAEQVPMASNQRSPSAEEVEEVRVSMARLNANQASRGG